MLRSWPYPLSGSPASILFFPGHSNTPRCSSLFISAGGWRSNSQGRPLAEFFVFEQEQETLLLTPRERVQAAWAELDKMHFGEKLRFAVDQGCKLVLSAGPQRPRSEE